MAQANQSLTHTTDKEYSPNCRLIRIWPNLNHTVITAIPAY